MNIIVTEDTLRPGKISGYLHTIKIGKSKLFTSLYHAILIFNNLEKDAFESIVRKGENAGKHCFLFFPHNVFYTS